MSTTTDPINQAARIAALFFSVVREGKEVFGGEPGRKDASQTEDGERILSAISDLSRQLEHSTSNIVGVIGQKFEQEQYEKLGASVKAVKLALEMRNRALIAASIPSLSEQVERAKNRLAEDKAGWFAPWLAGESVRLIGMHALIEDEGGHEAIQRLAANLRENVLEYSRGTLELRDRMPWRQIADFVKGDSEEILSLIAADSSNGMAGWNLVALPNSTDFEGTTVSEVRTYVGQHIKKGDILFMCETDKATLEHHAERDGTVRKVFISVGDKLTRGDALVALA